MERSCTVRVIDGTGRVFQYYPDGKITVEKSNRNGHFYMTIIRF